MQFQNGVLDTDWGHVPGESIRRKLSMDLQSTRRRVSDVRRTFLLFVTFDVLFISLLWIVELNIGNGLKDNIIREVTHYNFKNSLFDIFCLAVARSTLLLLAYALFNLRHWWMVAVTTFCSSAFLLAKVIMSKLLAQGAMGCVLPIISFLVAWLETWFLDFKVLPQEASDEARELSLFYSAHQPFALLTIGVACHH
uniref:MENTAL domain-containing protein n=1 Tax=Eptatretus burgeri TaxID=7764 RepID=A0A8C4WW20_EPTBU